MKKFSDMLEEKKVEEETGTSAVAGAGDDSSTVVVKKKKEKTLKRFNEEDPCWDGYKQVGMKKKGGKEVPNCVPESVELEEARKMSREWEAGYSDAKSGKQRDRRASAKYGPNANKYDDGYAAGSKEKDKEYSPRGKHQPDMFEGKELDEVSSDLLRRAADKAAKKGDEARQRGMTAAHGLQSTKKHADEAEKRAKQRGKFSRASTDKMLKGLKKESVELQERSPFELLKFKAGESLYKKNYQAALAAMKKTGKSAADVAKFHKGVDARTLNKMYMGEETMEEAYKSPAEAAAMEAGKKAARAGKSYADNPNKKGTPEFLAWSKGHNSARVAKHMREAVEIIEGKSNEEIQAEIDKLNKMVDRIGGNTSSVRMKKNAIYKKIDALEKQLKEDVEQIEEAYTKQQIMKIRQILGRDGQANKKVGVEKLMKHGNWSKGTAQNMYSAAMSESVELDEARDSYDIYHKDFSSAVQHAMAVAKKRGFEVDEDDWFNKVASGPRKPSEGKTNSYSVKVTKNGKPQKKALQMQVYNKGGSKPYELNMYIEGFEGEAISEETLTEASKTIDKVRAIVTDGQYAKIGGVMVDLFTASAIIQIYDKVSDDNKAKMDKMKITQLADLAYKMMRKR